MEWLTAIGAIAGPAISLADAFTGTSKAKAEAATAAANAHTAEVMATQMAHEADLKAQADQMHTYALYGLIAVGLVVGGFLLVKVL